MSKFLKVIVHTFIILAILIAAAIIIPPVVGVTTTIVDTETMDTNLPMGSVTYSKDILVSNLTEGDKVLKESDASTYAYRVIAGDVATGKYQVTNLYSNSGEEEIVLRNHVSRVVLTIPVIGYVLVAMHSMEGIIILGLVLLLMIVLFILSELWKKNDYEADDDDDDDDDDEVDDENEAVAGKVKSRRRAVREKHKASVSEDDEDDDDDDEDDDEADTALARRQKTEAKKAKKEAKKRAKAEAKRQKAEAKKAKKNRYDDDEDDDNDSPVISYYEEDAKKALREDSVTADDKGDEQAVVSQKTVSQKENTLKQGATASLADLLSESAFEMTREAEDELTADGAEADITEYLSDEAVNASESDEEVRSIVDRVTAAVEDNGAISSEGVSESSTDALTSYNSDGRESGDSDDIVSLVDADTIVVADITEAIVKEAEDRTEDGTGEAAGASIIIEETPKAEETSFVPVQRLTLDELMEEAQKNGVQPKMIKDPNTNVTLLDYSEVL